MENNHQSFWQFSDQLRVQTSNLANLSLNDSIWSSSNSNNSNNNYMMMSKGERRNFDIRVGGEINSEKVPPPSDFNDGWKQQIMNNNNNNNTSLYNPLLGGGFDAVEGLNGGFNKGI